MFPLSILLLVMKKNILTVLLLFVMPIAVGCQQSNSTSPQTSLPDKNVTSPSPNLQAKVESNRFFDEPLYLFANPEVEPLLKQGKYKSGLEHYTQVGQSTKKSDGNPCESFFMGTQGSDTVVSFGQGKHTHISGVKFAIVDKPGEDIPLKPESSGQGEVDILIGTKDGVNEFVVGSFITSFNPKPPIFYASKGDADFARVQNFTKSRDSIMLTGKPEQYKLTAADGNLKISTAAGDLVAIVEGVDNLTPSDAYRDKGVTIFK